jgi:3-hydroxybutyrate dehydrogenase
MNAADRGRGEMPGASGIDAAALSNSGASGISVDALRRINSANQSEQETVMPKQMLELPRLKTGPSKPSKIPSEFTGRAAIVTGSTSGIGLGIARAFAASGMNVMLNGFGDQKEIETTRSALEKEFNVGVMYSPADMTSPGDIAAMAEDTRRLFGQVDVLVNNAGIQHVEAIETFPVAKWDAIIAIDLSSAFHGIRAVVAGMKSRQWGRIINIASAHGLVASPFKSAYVAAKHGILGLTKTVALETATFGITVNAICPGYVLTPLVEKQIPETAKARGISEDDVIKNVLLHAQPTKQFVTTEQVGALAVFLCTSAAASITGAALPIEGGWTAQ